MPDQFREWISGRFPSSDPPAWRCLASAYEVRIVPARRPLLLLCVFIVGLAAVPVMIFWNPRGIGRPAELVLRVPFLFIASVFTLVVVVLFWEAARHLLAIAKGPYLIYSTRTLTAALPRAGACFGRKDLVGWRVVSGNWIGANGAQKRHEKPVSELQLIVERPDGRWTYVVAGTLKASITEEATEVARLTGLPLEIVVQHQGVTTPKPRVPSQSWRTP